MLFDELLAQILMGLGRPKQNPVGHDNSGSAADPKEPQEQREKEQLGLLGFDDLLEILRGCLEIQRPGEGRIGEDQTVAAGVSIVLFSEGVSINDIGVI